MLLMLANRDKKLLEQLGASEQVAVPVCCCWWCSQGLAAHRPDKEGPIRDTSNPPGCKDPLCCPHILS